MKATERVAVIEGVGQSGDGYARIDGRSVKVPGTLVGERVRLHVTGDRVSLLSVDEPSVERVTPPCPVFSTCGGCAWQHMSPAAQREARLEGVRRALPAALRSVPLDYHPSPLAYGWRGRARLGWQVVRGGTLLGFRGKGTTDVVDAANCHVLVPTLSAALGPLRAVLGQVARSGEVSMATGRDQRPVVSIHPDGKTAQGFNVPELLVAAGFAGAVLWVPGATVPAVAGDPMARVASIDGLDLCLAADGFAQANASLNPALSRHVVEKAAPAGRTVAELYAGAGTFTVLLAASALRVTAVESDAAAVAALRSNLAARSMDTVTVRHERAEDAVGGLKADILVLDPPRTGARDVAESVVRKAFRRIVYVSCDPATLGRDLGILAPRYDLASLSVFEMFPQTPHVELVATLVPDGGRSGGR